MRQRLCVWPDSGRNLHCDGNTDFKATWAVEINYYMDLGFLPENMQYFSISGRAGWYGPKGDAERLPASGVGVQQRHQDRIQQRTDPSDLRRQQGGLGREVLPLRDLWVAYRYWQNKFGLDHNAAPGVCTIAGNRR